MTQQPHPAPDSPARQAERWPDGWLAGLALLLLSLLGVPLASPPVGTQAVPAQSADSRAEPVAPSRAALPASERAEDERRLPSPVPIPGAGPDPAAPPSSFAMREDGCVGAGPMPAPVADQPRRAVRTGPRQPTGPPVPV